jgi:hypothetical protein
MPKNKPDFSRDFAIFVDDLGGLVWSCKTAAHATWQSLSAEVGVNAKTLERLANRKTKNPTAWTLWRVLRGLDNASVIRHSQLERYRGVSKPKPKPALKAVA